MEGKGEEFGCNCECVGRWPERRKRLRGLKGMINIQQEMSFCDSKRNKPRLLKSHLHWNCASQSTFQELALDLWTSHLCPLPHSFLPTWAYGSCLLSQQVPRFFSLFQKGNQVRLKDSKTCLLKNRTWDLFGSHTVTTTFLSHDCAQYWHNIV
jgi:hypothetical protein